MLEELFESSYSVKPAERCPEDFESIPTCKGVILFADPEDRPIQLLTAANMRRLAVSRLASPESETKRRKTNVGEIVANIYTQRCYNDFKSSMEHYRIARTLWPGNYQDTVKVARQSFVRIDFDIELPFFSITDKPAFSKSEKLFSPFPTRKSAREFVDALQDGFNLCRRPNVLNDYKRASSCAYLQMSSCPGVCAGKTQKGDYLKQVHEAISAACGDVESTIDRLENLMKEFSAQMDFESAGVVKKQIERLQALQRPVYEWTRNLSDFCVLHIDRWTKVAIESSRKKVQTYAAYLIKWGQNIELGNFQIDDMGDFYKLLAAEIDNKNPGTAQQELLEQFSLAAYFLYRSKPPGVWLDCSKQKGLPGIETIRKAICERFGATGDD